MSYFVLLRNPSNGARLPLVRHDDPDVIAVYETEAGAIGDAHKTLFGGSGYYEVYSTEDTR